jgi:hypothetical protein
MKLLMTTFACVVLYSATVAAQDPACGAKGPSPAPGQIKLISWNIQELATQVQIYNRPIRSEDDFRGLRFYRDCNGGDVYALQEIGSLRALGRVFPPSEYILCISGQTVADQRGLSPDYPRDQLRGIAPQCVTDKDAAVSSLPGELTDPARQYVGLAIKRASGVTLMGAEDVPDLGPKDPVNNRQTRWGLEVTVKKGSGSLRLLVVHMKASCNEAPIEEPSDNDNCPALFRQLQPLKKWIADNARHPAIVLGDFNRRLDRESPDVKGTDMWDVINGAATASPNDDVKLVHIPANKEFKCWPKEPATQRFPIDFFVLNDPAAKIADAGSYWKWRYGKDIEDVTPRSAWPSDHCPIQLNVSLP